MIGGIIAGACGKELAIKVYRSNVELGGLHRPQDSDPLKRLILYKDSGGYYCVDEAGMRKLTEALKTCKDLCDK